MYFYGTLCIPSHLWNCFHTSARGVCAYVCVCVSETQDSWESKPIPFSLLGRNALVCDRNWISEGGDCPKREQMLSHSSPVEMLATHF